LFASFFIFHGGTRNIFRSDYWLIATLFNTQSITSLADLKRIVFFEMFGDIRFQPLGHMAMYIRHLAFGNSIMAYNILNIVLHSITAFLIYLIILEITRTTSLASVLGAIYIVLPSQFDCIIWTYHIYILLSTICVLISVYLVLRYILTERIHLFYLALMMDLFAILLYEPTLFSPAFLFLFLVGMTRWLDKKLTRRQIFFVAGSILVFYACYFILATVSLTYLNMKKSERMSLADLFQWKNLVQCCVGIWMNLWKTNFITNIGILPQIKIDDILYIHPSKEIFKNLNNILILFCGIFFLSCFRIFKKNIWIIFSLLGIAISYIFIISMGRVLTNDLEYVITQPRYQYFVNAVLFIGIGVLLVRKYEKKAIRVGLIYFLATIFFLNSLNVMEGIKEVSAAMRPINEHYYILKEFINKNEKTKIFLNFVPDMKKRFFLGTDIALDLLFKGHTTKFLDRAAYIYDGKEFKRNPLYQIGNPYHSLPDFTIEWMYRHLAHQRPTREVVIIGREGVYPRIGMTPDGLVKIIMINQESRKLEEYVFRHPYGEKPGGWSSFVIEKSGNGIAFIFDGTFQEKIQLIGGLYSEWHKDGSELLGDYYRGAGDVVFVSRLFIQLGSAKYGCKELKKGDKVPVEVKIPW